MKYAGPLAIALLAWGAASAQAQYDYRYGNGPYYGGGYGAYYGGGGGTVAGNALGGMADVIRSTGQYNLQTSQAAINVEDARSKNFDNRIKYTQTYFEKRKMNREYRAAERPARLSSEQLAHIAAEAAPERLSGGQLNPITGRIVWPILLQANKYSAMRQEIEQGFANRAEKEGAIGTDAYLKIQSDIRKMQEMLSGDVGSVPPQDYIYAKNFLESLAYESRFPTS